LDCSVSAMRSEWCDVDSLCSCTQSVGLCLQFGCINCNNFDTVCRYCRLETTTTLRTVTFGRMKSVYMQLLRTFTFLKPTESHYCRETPRCYCKFRSIRSLQAVVFLWYLYANTSWSIPAHPAPQDLLTYCTLFQSTLCPVRYLQLTVQPRCTLLRLCQLILGLFLFICLINLFVFISLTQNSG